MIITGIDPGKKGAIVILDDHGKVLEMTPMPLLKDEMDPWTIYDTLNLLLRIESRHSVSVFLEKAQAFRGQGVSSTFNYGVGFGFIQMAVVALQLPYTLVTPQKWQKVMFQGTDSSLEPKARAAIAATRLAGMSFKATERSKKPHEGMVDAYLIARWGLRELNGGKGAA